MWDVFRKLYQLLEDLCSKRPKNVCFIAIVDNFFKIMNRLKRKSSFPIYPKRTNVFYDVKYNQAKMLGIFILE